MIMTTLRPKFAGSKEKGSILFVGLIFLVVLTLLGLSAFRTATVQERMAGNMRDRNIAFQAAESALRAAETYLVKTPNPPTATGFDGSKCTAKGVYKLSGVVPYFIAAGKTAVKPWDGASPDFWNSYPWDEDTCAFNGSTDYVNYVASGDLGKAGKPVKLPRYVIEELPANSSGIKSSRVTSIGWGSSENSVVILQATYTSN